MAKVMFAVYVDLDPVPGTFHDKESARVVIETVIKQQLRHYNPEVTTGQEL